jgi:hypothetical protein
MSVGLADDELGLVVGTGGDVVVARVRVGGHDVVGVPGVLVGDSSRGRDRGVGVSMGGRAGRVSEVVMVSMAVAIGVFLGLVGEVDVR